MGRKTFAIGAIALTGLLCMQASGASDLKSPDQVRNGLRILAYVQADMSSKLPSKSYSRLPHENQEFQEAAVPMREAVAAEPATLKSQVDALLTKAQVAANRVAEISQTNDEEKITAAVQAVADALQPLYALFPVELRPVAGQLGTGPGRRGGPPADLR